MLQLQPSGPAADSRLLSSGRGYDDAALIQVNESTCLVQTVDFFTPVVDDPYWFGRIAAANSLSDVYAMGGVPVSAMNVACFPIRALGTDPLARILQGGSDTLALAGAVQAGGHTVEDAEPKFGMAVTGLVNPNQVTAKGGLLPGQELWLTKPLGSGLITTAHKRELVGGAQLQPAIDWMCQLNDVPSRCMVQLGCRAATDVTGYGLIGHALEMARGGHLTLHLQAGAVPVMQGAWQFLEQGCLSGGSQANRRWAEATGQLHWTEAVPQATRSLLCDAQTSGGLLLGLAPEQGEAFLRAMSAAGREAWRVGHTAAGPAAVLVSP